MRRFILLIILPSFTLMPFVVRAETVAMENKAQGLLDVYHEAQKQDATWRAAEATHKAQQEKLPEARARFLPSVTGSANTTYNDINTQYHAPVVFPSGDQRFNSNGYNLTLDQPLYNPQNAAQYHEARAQTTESDLQLQLAAHDLMLRVSQAYFAVLSAQDNVDLAIAQKAAIAQQLELAKRGFEAGTLTITDTNEAQARFDLINSQEIAARNDLEITKESLEKVTGDPIAQILPLNPNLNLLPPEPNDINQWVEMAQQENLQLKMQQQAVEIAAQEVKRNRAEHLPTVDAIANYGKTTASGNAILGVGSDVTSKTIGLQLTIPFFQGGAQQARVREALANEDKAQQDLEEIRRNTILTTRQAFLGVTNGLQQIQALNQALISSETSLQSNQLGLKVGVRTGIDVLNAQQQLYNAKRALYTARYNYLINQLKLKSAVNRLNEADLTQINQMLALNPLPTSTK